MIATRFVFGSFTLFASMAVSATANAGSMFDTADTTPVTAATHLDFTIIVPKFVYLRVGTGAVAADSSTVDNLVYSVPADHNGDGTPVTAANGQVAAQVIGNNGAITLSSATQGAMNDGAGDTISYSQMDVAVSSDTTATALSHPVLVDGTATSISLPTTNGSVTNLDGTWTFTYLNTTVVPAGTYGGVNSGNGRVTYSVSMP